MSAEALKRCLTDWLNLAGVTDSAYNDDKCGPQAPRALTRSIGRSYHPRGVVAVWTVRCSPCLPRASLAPASHGQPRAVRGERVGHER